MVRRLRPVEPGEPEEDLPGGPTWESRSTSPGRPIRSRTVRCVDTRARSTRPEEGRVREEQEEILKRSTDDDVSVRAKSSGHGKKTADKWNQ